MNRNADETKGKTYEDNFKIGYPKQAMERKWDDGKHNSQVRK